VDIEVLTITEASERLGISISTVQRRLTNGELEAVTVEGRQYVKLPVMAADAAANAIAVIVESDIIDATPVDETTRDSVTIGDAAKRLGVSVKTIKRRIRRGELETVESKGTQLVLLPVATGNAPGHAILATRDTTGDAVALRRDLHQEQGYEQGYSARDVEMVISQAIAEGITAAQTSLLMRIEDLHTTQTSLVEHIESLADAQVLRMEEIKQLKKDRTRLIEVLAEQAAAQDGQTAEIAILREELAKLRQAQENPSEEMQEKTQQKTQAAVEKAMGRSLVPYLKHLRMLSTATETLKAENNLLEVQLEMARSPWWKFWRR
jgi:excisionase family DNA binding protein